MGARHVVGEDLEAGAGVDLGLVGEEQVLVRLAGVGADRAGPDDDMAVEHAVAVVVHDALVELAAGAVRRGVLDQDRVVVVLVAAGQVEAVEADLGAFALEADPDLVAGDAATRARPSARRSGCLGPGGPRATRDGSGLGLVLDLVVLDVGAFVEDDLGDGVRAVDVAGRPAWVSTMVAWLPGPARTTERGLDTTGDAAGVGEEHELDRLVDDGAGGELDECPVVGEGGVERREGVVDTARTRREKTARSARPPRRAPRRGSSPWRRSGSPSTRDSSGAKWPLTKTRRAPPRSRPSAVDRHRRVHGRSSPGRAGSKGTPRMGRARVAPVLVLRRREAVRRSPTDAARRASVSQAGPSLVGLGRRSVEAARSERIGDAASCRRSPVVTASPSTGADRSAATPRRDRRSRAPRARRASSLPPERTIRPSARTWTRSGTM